MGKGGQPVFVGHSEKSAPVVHLGISDYEKKIPMKGISSAKVGQKVCVMIMGKVTGIRKDKHGESIDIEMSEAHVTKPDSDMEDMMKHY